MLFREAAVRRALKFEGTREQPPGSNRGKLIDKWNTLAGVPLGSPYCMTFVHAMFLLEGLDIGGVKGDASVGFFEEWGRTRGQLVKAPAYGDLGCWDLTGDQWEDHVFMVVRRVSLKPLRVLTIEANTSRGSAGSQDEGGGVWRRDRTLKPGSVRFVRIPGEKPGGSKPPLFVIRYRHGIPYVEPEGTK